MKFFPLELLTLTLRRKHCFRVLNTINPLLSPLRTYFSRLEEGGLNRDRGLTNNKQTTNFIENWKITNYITFPPANNKDDGVSCPRSHPESVHIRFYSRD